MRRSFWKATGISVAAYGGALLIGFLVDFRLTLFTILALQVTWTLFCVARAIQLRLGGSNKPDAPSYDRETYGFALGGSTSSLLCFLLMVVLTQVV